jgi:transcriptional regulator with XRE-family HTH domain
MAEGCMTNRERAWAHANAYKLRAEGLSITEVAERLEVARATVGKWLRGVGERCLRRECELGGEPFLTNTARQRFCTPEHAEMHRRIYGPPTQLEVYRSRARELEAELAELRERVAA